MRWLLLLLVACGGGSSAPETPDETPIGPVAEAGEPITSFVGSSVTLSGAGSEGTSFMWSFGNGQSTPSQLLPNTTYTWSEPGHYTAVLQATGTEGTYATDTVAVTIVHPRDSAVPNRSGTIAAVGDRLLVVQPDHDSLAIVDRSTHGVAVLGTCGTPRSISAGADRVAVACERDEVRLYDLDLVEQARIAFPWGSRPFGVVVDHTGRIAVTLQGQGAVAFVDDTGILQTLPLGPDLRGLASYEAGILASRHRSGPGYGTLHHLGELTTEQWSLSPDPGPDSDTDARGLPTYLERVAVRPDGRVAVTGGLKANTERGVHRDGLPLTHETTARSVVRQVALHPDEGAAGTELAEPRFDDRDRVSALAYSPLGDWLYVAHHGAEMVDIVDSYTMERVGGFHDVGHGPTGLWVGEDPAELWVYAELSRELAVYDLTDPFAPQVELDRIDLNAGRVEPLGEFELLGKQVFHSAADPRMTATGYISCASCHLDGEHDGLTWDFTDRDEGLRNTISLRGPVAAPLHWSGNFDEFQDFEIDIRGPQQGDGFLSEVDWAEASDPLGPSKAGLSTELDAMAAWLASLDQPLRSPWREPGGELPEGANGGRLIFESLATRCSDCHPPPDYTDSTFQGPGLPLLHDVGTLTGASGQRLGDPLTGIDTPSLRGLFATAPYLHDGSFDTVRDMLVANQADDLHGVTSHLDTWEIDQLELFLLTLE